MATKLFLRRQAQTTGISPTPDSGWEDTASIVRCWTSTTTSSDSHALVTITETSSTDKDVLARQYIAPLKKGQTITGGQAVQFVARFQETTSSNNMFSAFGIRIINQSGTVQKTVLAVTRDGTEVVASPTTATNRDHSTTSAATNYTTVAGDYLVIEIGAGGDPAGSNPHTYDISLGDNVGTFLTANDTGTTDNDPWVQLNDTLVLEYSIDLPAVSLSTILGQTVLGVYDLTTGTPVNQATIFPPSNVVPIATFRAPRYVVRETPFRRRRHSTPSRVPSFTVLNLNLPILLLSNEFAPTLSYAVDAPFLSVSTIFTPVVDLPVDRPSPPKARRKRRVEARSTTTTFRTPVDPTLTLSLPLVSGSSIFAPTVDTLVTLLPPTVSLSVIFPPGVTNTLLPPSLSVSTIFAPSVANETAKPLRSFIKHRKRLESRSRPFSVRKGVDPSQPISLPTLSASTIFAPTVDQLPTLFPPAVSLTQIFTPSVAFLELSLTLGFLPKREALDDRNKRRMKRHLRAVVYNTSGQSLSLPAVSLSQIFTPTISTGAVTLTLPATSLSVIFAPTMAGEVDPATVSQSTIFAPTISSFTIFLPFTSLSVIYSPTVSGGVQSTLLPYRQISLKIGLTIS